MKVFIDFGRISVKGWSLSLKCKLGELELGSMGWTEVSEGILISQDIVAV